ncbi:MAG: hypothetical protein WC979_05165 [Candidatus Pacearchaeota archaeon]|jgi:hypothetical protein
MKIKSFNKKAVWSDAMQIVLWIIVFAVLCYAVYLAAKKIGFI